MTEIPIYPETMEPVNNLRQWPGNARRQDIDKIAKAIKKYGFYSALVVQASTRKIIIGNHRYLAGKLMGMTVFPCKVIDVTDDVAGRMNVWDNKVTDDGSYDVDALIAQLEEIAKSDEGLEHTGYDSDELAELILAQQKEDRADLPEDDGPGLGDAKQKGAYLVCPNCDYHFRESEAERDDA